MEFKMKVKVEITTDELKDMILQKLETMFTVADFKKENVKIEVKTKQNYRAEWETGEFRASYEGEVK
jgi:hypothetical protein